MTLPHGSRLRAASVPPWEPAVEMSTEAEAQTAIAKLNG